MTEFLKAVELHAKAVDLLISAMWSIFTMALILRWFLKKD